MVHAVEWLHVRLGIDDPAGTISVHRSAAMWGVLAAGFFTGNVPIQLAAISTLLGFVLPPWTGAGAWPEFFAHGEDFLQR